jgi:hypothetical protein
MSIGPRAVRGISANIDPALASGDSIDFQGAWSRIRCCGQGRIGFDLRGILFCGVEGFFARCRQDTGYSSPGVSIFPDMTIRCQTKGIDHTMLPKSQSEVGDAPPAPETSRTYVVSSVSAWFRQASSVCGRQFLGVLLFFPVLQEGYCIIPIQYWRSITERPIEAYYGQSQRGA